MRAKRIMANLRVPDVDAAKSFYTDYLGLSIEEFNMGWVARYTSPDTGAERTTRNARSTRTRRLGHFRSHGRRPRCLRRSRQKLGYQIVHPLTTEQWGVRRFFVRAPDGNVINIVNHRD